MKKEDTWILTEDSDCAHTGIKKNEIGDEFHYFFECTNSNIVNARLTYLPQHFCETPTLHNEIPKQNDTTTFHIYKFVKVVLNTVQ